MEMAPTRGQVPPTRGQVPPTRGQVPPTRGQVPPTKHLSTSLTAVMTGPSHQPQCEQVVSPKVDVPGPSSPSPQVPCLSAQSPGGSGVGSQP